MATIVDYSARFLKDLDNLERQYPGTLNIIDELLQQLKRDERPGDRIPRVGYSVYKVRLPNPAANKGKSGGFRAIYYVRIADRVLMVTLYSKSKQVDISPEKLRAIIEEEESR